MINSRSILGITYLIAVNLVVLLFSIFMCWLHRDQGPDHPMAFPWICVCVGIGIGQATMLGAYLAIAKLPFLVRLRWFSRLLTAQWFCFTVPLVPQDLRSEPHWPWPWCVMVDQLLVAMAAFLSVGIFRWISGRAVSGPDLAGPDLFDPDLFDPVVSGREETIASENSVEQPFQFRIFDLLLLISLVALVLATTMRYRNELHGFDGLIYAVLVMLGLYIGSPIGAIVSLFLIGLLSKEKEVVVLTAFALVFALSVLLGPVVALYMEEQGRIGTLFFCVAGLVLVFANTFVLRGLCYRLCKLPRKGNTESMLHTSKMDGEVVDA